MDLEGGLDCNFGKFYQSNKRTTVIIVTFFVFEFFQRNAPFGELCDSNIQNTCKKCQRSDEKIKKSRNFSKIILIFPRIFSGILEPSQLSKNTIFSKFVMRVFHNQIASFWVNFLPKPSKIDSENAQRALKNVKHIDNLRKCFKLHQNACRPF